MEVHCPWGYAYEEMRLTTLLILRVLAKAALSFWWAKLPMVGPSFRKTCQLYEPCTSQHKRETEK